MKNSNSFKIPEHFQDLEKRIRRVQFARIEAAKRLREKNNKYTLITSCYAISITFLAIIFSTVNFQELNTKDANIFISLFVDYQTMSVFILALSSFITMITLYVAHRNYGEKNAHFQSNYMELTRLHSDIKNFIVYYQLHNDSSFKDFKIEKWLKKDKYKDKDLEKRLVKKYRLFADKYAALLTQSENHEVVDYKRAKIDDLTKEIENLEESLLMNTCETDVYKKEKRLGLLKSRKQTLYFSVAHQENKDLIKCFLLIFSPALLVLLVILFYILHQFIRLIIYS